jgi:tetratricopeptide (TPR) repeat protein
MIDLKIIIEKLVQLNNSQFEQVITDSKADKNHINMNGTKYQISASFVESMNGNEEKLEQLQEIINTVANLTLRRDTETRSRETGVKLPLRPNFIGREEAIDDIKNIFHCGSKIVVIQAAGGIGKTTLAEQFFAIQEYGCVIKLSMAKETENIDSVEKSVEYLLRELQEKPEPEFDNNLSILRNKLKNINGEQKIGIIIDNLEPALNKNGKFIDEHRQYVNLLKILADSSVQALTLITSSVTLYENIDNIERYSLLGLSVETWQEFFENLDIQTESRVIEEINKAYGGNAKCMEILSGYIKKSYGGNLTQFWETKKEILLISPDLKNLVKSQFDPLEILDIDAYRLLCRLGCYLYQDIPNLPEEGLLYLLWDISEEVDPIEIIDCLRDCFLVEFDSDKYWLHPVIQAEAIRRLKSHPEEWKYTNIKIAEFYFKTAEDISKPSQAKAAFEAINHYNKAGEFGKSYQTLLHILDATNNLENLRCSENLWLYMSRIIEICEILNDKLTGVDLAIILIPLGFLYPEIGKNNQAIKVSEIISTIIQKIPEQYPTDRKSIIAQISAHIISGRANKLIGDFPKALEACEAASKLAKDADENYWKAFALYELGTVHLERAKLRESSYLEAGKALRCIVASAFLAVGVTKMPEIIYNFLTIPLEEIPGRLQNIIDKFFARRENGSRDNDYTKMFRILHGVGKCLNLMKIYPISRLLLIEAQKKLPKTDNLNQTWSYLEIALCSSEKEAEDYYQKALETDNFRSLSTLCKAHVLFEYGNFQSKQGCYIEAIKEYLKLEELLEKKTKELPEGTTFESLKARNYYNICQVYLKLTPDLRVEIGNSIKNIFDYQVKSHKICKKISLPYYKDEVIQLGIEMDIALL